MLSTLLEMGYESQLCGCCMRAIEDGEASEEEMRLSWLNNTWRTSTSHSDEAAENYYVAQNKWKKVKNIFFKKKKKVAMALDPRSKGQWYLRDGKQKKCAVQLSKKTPWIVSRTH